MSLDIFLHEPTAQCACIQSCSYAPNAYVTPYIPYCADCGHCAILIWPLVATWIQTPGHTHEVRNCEFRCSPHFRLIAAVCIQSTNPCLSVADCTHQSRNRALHSIVTWIVSATLHSCVLAVRRDNQAAHHTHDPIHRHTSRVSSNLLACFTLCNEPNAYVWTCMSQYKQDTFLGPIKHVGFCKPLVNALASNAWLFLS